MIIKKARVEDAEDIRKLSLELTVSRPEGRGFVEFKTPSLEEYRMRLFAEWLFSYVAEDEGKIVGFSLSYYDGSYFMGTNPIFSYLRTKPKPFIYSEQLGVQKTYQRKGIGIALQRILFDDARERGDRTIWGAVAHNPANEPSIYLLKKMGYTSEEEIDVDEMVFGIYKKEL